MEFRPNWDVMDRQLIFEIFLQELNTICVTSNVHVMGQCILCKGVVCLCNQWFYKLFFVG